MIGLFWGSTLCYCHRSLVHVMRSNTLSCLNPLHARHIDCRLLMSWLGGSLAIMWSMVQSLPSRSLAHLTHTGSSMVLAYALALTHSLLLCHSAIVSCACITAWFFFSVYGSVNYVAYTLTFHPVQCMLHSFDQVIAYMGCYVVVE